jgi:ABC-type nickel/cobalt efflux system permease component RcnA
MDAKATHRRAAVRAVVFAVLTAVVLFGSAGTLRWWNGWVYIASFALVIATLAGTVFRKSPELVEELAQPPVIVSGHPSIDHVRPFVSRARRAAPFCV